MISGLGDRNKQERLKEIKLTSLEARHNELDMLETYNTMSGVSDVDSPTIFFYVSCFH